MRWWWRSIAVLAALALALVSLARVADAPAHAGERIPGAAHVLEVTVRRPDRPPASEVTVTNHARVRRFASLINGLETVQPGALDCTGKADDPVVTFTFRAAPGGRVLARASQIVATGAGRESCEPMTLTIRGRPSMPLLGGTSVVRAAQRLPGAVQDLG
jgi:hypothetical protein